ncbi:MAG TPA: SAF domain-containing protein, partial [Motilibacterales bacterium]|nr:SAF domain-containing protein [Motilibacterales bacterium]
PAGPDATGADMTTASSTTSGRAQRPQTSSPRQGGTPTGVVSSGIAPVRGRRRPWLIGLGALLAALGALTVVWLVGAAGQRQEVLVVRADVAYGQAVTGDDIAIARVSVDPGVSVLSAAERDAVVGQVATTRLAPGMLLTAGLLEPAGEPGRGRVLVPVAVPSERMPAGGLRAGDRILAVDAESAAGGSGVGSGVAGAAPIAATVVRVGAADINGVTVVDVTTAAAAGPRLAVSAANGHVALVVEPGGS